MARSNICLSLLAPALFIACLHLCKFFAMLSGRRKLCFLPTQPSFVLFYGIASEHLMLYFTLSEFFLCDWKYRHMTCYAFAHGLYFGGQSPAVRYQIKHGLKGMCLHRRRHWGHVTRKPSDFAGHICVHMSSICISGTCVLKPSCTYSTSCFTCNSVRTSNRNTAYTFPSPLHAMCK